MAIAGIVCVNTRTGYAAKYKNSKRSIIVAVSTPKKILRERPINAVVNVVRACSIRRGKSLLKA